MIDVIMQTFHSFMTQPQLFGSVFLGVVLGMIMGILPGISSTMSLAVLLPLTFGVDPIAGIAFLIAVYSSSTYSGSITAILLNIPGTPSAIVTQIDGHPMAKKGRAGEAITYSTLGSAGGGLLGWIILAMFAPLVARMALNFRSPEYTTLTLFGLSMLAYASPGSTFKGIMSGILGLILATIGLDPLTFVSRLDFGVNDLLAGIHIIPLAVGIFGLAEVLIGLEDIGRGFRLDDAPISRIGRIFPPWEEMKSKWRPMMRGGIIGVIVGAIPAAGSAISVVISYSQEKRLSRHPELFGTGVPEGIVAPESSNNASVGGALIPMMTLGIPGDPMTAVLIGGLLIHGLRPGPSLFKNNLPFVASVYVSLFLAIVLTTLIAFATLRYLVRVVQIPRHVLLPAVALLTVVGSYAVNNSLFDVGLMILFGVLGYLMNKGGIPLAPLAFGLILGPILEENLRRTLVVSQGDWSVFVTRPISLVLLIIAVVAMAYPAIAYVLGRGTRTVDAAGNDEGVDTHAGS